MLIRFVNVLERRIVVPFFSSRKVRPLLQQELRFLRCRRRFSHLYTSCRGVFCVVVSSRYGWRLFNWEHQQTLFTLFLKQGKYQTMGISLVHKTLPICSKGFVSLVYFASDSFSLLVIFWIVILSIFQIRMTFYKIYISRSFLLLLTFGLSIHVFMYWVGTLFPFYSLQKLEELDPRTPNCRCTSDLYLRNMGLLSPKIEPGTYFVLDLSCYVRGTAGVRGVFLFFFFWMVVFLRIDETDLKPISLFSVDLDKWKILKSQV